MKKPRVRIGFVIALAIVLGLAAGAGATLAEFGHDEARPSLAVSGVPLNTTGPPPRAVVQQARHEFGQMDDTAVGQHTFVIENQGAGPLTLGKPESCSCISASLSRDHIPPHETAEVKVQWRPLNFTGEFIKAVTIATNDPAGRSLSLTVHGEVIAAWRLMPASLTFPPTLATEERAMTADLLVYRGDKCELLGTEWTNQEIAPQFRLTCEELPASALTQFRPVPKSGLRLKFALGPGTPLGGWTQPVLLKTTLNNKAPIAITLNGEIVQEITFFGAGYWPNGMFQMGKFKQGTPATRRLWLKLRGPQRKETNFTLVKVVPEDLKVTFGEPKDEEDENALRIAVNIEVPATARPVKLLGPKPEDQGELVIATTNPQQQELRLHLQLAVEGGSK